MSNVNAPSDVFVSRSLLEIAVSFGFGVGIVPPSTSTRVNGRELLTGGKNLVLGHVAASGGKPLLKVIARGKVYAGTLEFLSAIRNGEAGEALLGFDEDGLPVVKLEVSR
jgi:hypothetical protein